MVPESILIITDETCPKDKIYKVTNAYAKTNPNWVGLIDENITHVILHHPDLDPKDVPGLFYAWCP